METKTDAELIDELASRHDELIVIRPKRSNKDGSKNTIVIFCKTKDGGDSYDLCQATELLHEGQVGLIRDCLVEKENDSA